MRRLVPLLALATLACADNPAAPSGLYPGYSLVTINGKFLPTRDDDTPPDAEIISGSLSFDRARPRAGTPGVVTYSRWLRRPNQPLERVTLELDYTVADGILRINLCPPLALCIITTELVGPAQVDRLVLTHFLGGVAGTVYQFHPALPE